MTENVKKQTCELLDIDAEIPWEKDRKRHQRRRNTALKKAKFYALVSQRYSHAGYVSWDQQGQCVGHAKHASRSNCQRWIKRTTSRSVRKYCQLPPKGAHYRRLVDYWGILY